MHELLREILLDMFGLPICDADFLQGLPLGVLHEEVGWRTLRVRHLQILVAICMLLDELVKRWIVPNASAAHVEDGLCIMHGLRVLSCAALLTLADEHVISQYIPKLSA